MKGRSVLDHMREICLALPDTKETLTWGEPHFRVGDKIFAGCGDENGRTVIGFKLEMDHADAVIQDPRFWRAPYVGHKGWVSMDASALDDVDWDEVKALVRESYGLIAPRKKAKPEKKTTKAKKKAKARAGNRTAKPRSARTARPGTRRS